MAPASTPAGSCAVRIVGSGGVELHDRWDGDARAYLGMTTPGFPNLFMIYGPNTNIVVNGSIIFFSECSVRYIVGCLKLMAETGRRDPGGAARTCTTPSTPRSTRPTR